MRRCSSYMFVRDPTIQARYCTPQRSNVTETTMFTTTPTKSVVRAGYGSFINSKRITVNFGGDNRITVFIRPKTMSENISQPVGGTTTIRYSTKKTRRGHPLPFVHIGFLNGGPMLNTAAVNTYWEHETKNNTEFSKFVASSLSLFPGLYGGGGEYLLHFRHGPNKHSSMIPYHVCALTQWKAQNCAMAIMRICPMILVKTFFETRLAVGRLICRTG